MKYNGDKSYDEIDVKIINELQKNGRISVKALGEKVHLTGQAVKNRIDRLEGIGVLQHYTINVDCPVFGYKVHAIIEMELDKGKREEFLNIIRTATNPIERCYLTTGERRYIMDAYFLDMDDLKSFQSALEPLGDYKVHIVLEDTLV